MGEIKLLPCPFCGGEARLQRRQHTRHGYYVICKECGCRTPLFQYQFDSVEKLREQAIEAWNTRKPMGRIIDQLEEIDCDFKWCGDCANCYRYECIRKAIDIVKRGGGDE